MMDSLSKVYLGVLLLLGLTGAGCRVSPPPHSGFLSDYTKLEKIDRSTHRFVAEDFVAPDTFLLEPVELERGASDSRLTQEQLLEAAAYFTAQLEQALISEGFAVIGAVPSASDTARFATIRLAITDVRSSTVLLNLHPGSKLTGAGTGGAAMEGEIIDLQTGQQLAAFVQAGRGNQFELDPFSRMDDVKDVIDQWCQQLAADLAARRVQRE